MEILQRRFFPAAPKVGDPVARRGPQTYVRTYTHLHAHKETFTRRYDDVECRYHRRENVEWNYVKRRYPTLCWRGFTVLPSESRAPLLILLLLLRLRLRLRAVRRLKGYKRTDPCVSPLFPLIFLLENPQSVRSGGYLLFSHSLSLSLSVPMRTELRSQHKLRDARSRQEEDTRHYLM